MAVINFDGYKVNKMIYEKNHHFIKPEDGINFRNNLNFDFHINEEVSEAVISIDFNTGDLEDTVHPFYINVEIEGYFKYDVEKDDAEIGFKKLLKNNSAAILYPYLRNIVSNLTNIANDYPTYLLPTINIAKSINQKNEEEQKREH